MDRNRAQEMELGHKPATTEAEARRAIKRDHADTVKASLAARRHRRAEDDKLMLGTRSCARWMGVSTAYIVAEIQEGFLIANNVGKLQHRHDYRIYFQNFVAYLRARGWRRIPIDPTELTGRPL